MNYTLHQLQVFVRVVETRSVTRAAEELHMTQPAVSIQLKNFQDQFDIALTEVVGRQLYVTEFGKEIAQRAEKILNEVYAINYQTLSYKGVLSGRLRIAIVTTGKYVMPHFLADFLQQHLGVELRMSVDNRSRVIEMLEDNAVDFALMSVSPDNLKLEEEILLSNHLFLIGNKPAARSKKWGLRDLSEMPFVFREEGSGTRMVIESHLKKAGVQLNKRLELDTNESVKQAIIAGLGNSILPLIGLKNEIQNGELYIWPLSGFPIHSEWKLVWLKNKKHSPVAESYLSFLKNHKEHIRRERFGWTEPYIGKSK